MLSSFALGPAAKTLHALDLSSTFVADADVEAVSRFPDLKELQLNMCPFITKDTLTCVARHCSNLEILQVNRAEISIPDIVSAVVGKPNEDPLPKLKELHMESDDWGKYSAALTMFLDKRKNLAQLRVWAVVPSLEFSTSHTTGETNEEAMLLRFHSSGMFCLRCAFFFFFFSSFFFADTPFASQWEILVESPAPTFCAHTFCDVPCSD